MMADILYIPIKKTFKILLKTFAYLLKTCVNSVYTHKSLHISYKYLRNQFYHIITHFPDMQ